MGAPATVHDGVLVSPVSLKTQTYNGPVIALQHQQENGASFSPAHYGYADRNQENSHYKKRPVGTLYRCGPFAGHSGRVMHSRQIQSAAFVRISSRAGSEKWQIALSD
jgi:hypothetical protein